MNIGKILGSISPAFGLISGQGLGQYLKYLSPGLMLGEVLGGHHHDGQQSATDPAATPAQPDLASLVGGQQQSDPMADASSRIAAMSPQGMQSGMQQGMPQNIQSYLAYLMSRGGGGGNFLGRMGGGY